MSYDEKPQAREHAITLKNRAQLSVTGVDDVESFDENTVIMSTSQGNLIVRGEGLHIGTIALDRGELSVEGLITDLGYEEQRTSQGFFRKLFG